jgi:hypothetical protein
MIAREAAAREWWPVRSPRWGATNTTPRSIAPWAMTTTSSRPSPVTSPTFCRSMSSEPHRPYRVSGAASSSTAPGVPPGKNASPPVVSAVPGDPGLPVVAVDYDVGLAVSVLVADQHPEPARVSASLRVQVGGGGVVGGVGRVELEQEQRPRPDRAAVHAEPAHRVGLGGCLLDAVPRTYPRPRQPEVDDPVPVPVLRGHVPSRDVVVEEAARRDDSRRWIPRGGSGPSNTSPLSDWTTSSSPARVRSTLHWTIPPTPQPTWSRGRRTRPVASPASSSARRGGTNTARPLARRDVVSACRPGAALDEARSGRPAPARRCP